MSMAQQGGKITAAIHKKITEALRPTIMMIKVHNVS